MAEIRKIVRSPVLSNFQQVAPEAGGMFRALAVAAEAAYSRLAPAALKEQEEKGTQLGLDMARQQIGDPLAGTPIAPANHEGVTPGANAAFASLQTAWGKPLKVNSAYRSPEHNAKVGGAKNSQHTHGNAFDVDVSDLSEADRVDLITKARASGFKGIGVYDNALHFDVGPERAWGPDYHRGSLPAWASGAVTSPVGGGEVARSDYQPTVLRTSDGKLEGRLYSPLSGEILAAHDAAAGVAYTSEVLTKGITDMMALSDQFALDPEGFRGAARSYVDDLVSKAPERFRTDMRASLEKEMTRRFLGVMEEKQRDTRQRANNSSAALVDRWSQNYAEAVASGNKDEIDSARAELDSILFARERLPGVSWTPEQSQNVIMKAQDEADRIRASRTSEVRKQNEDALDTIISAAKEGLHAGNEALLSDPTIQAAMPELWKKAVGAVTIRDWLPTFRSSTPDQQASTIAAMRGEPVTNDLQVDVIGAAEDAHAASVKAWNDDPIAQAEKVLPQKPPPLPDFTSGDPNTFVKALAARRAYAKGLRANGYVDFDAFLSDEEAKDIGLILGKETPPELKLPLVSAIVAGFGDDAAKVLSEVKSNDPTTLYSGMLVARGGDPSVAMEAMRGQALLDEKLVTLPEAAERRGALTEGMATALMAAGVDSVKQGQIMTFANAIYASRARNLDPKSQEAVGIMRDAVQAALGQKTDKRGALTGGIQEVGGNDVLLPVGVAGIALDAALDKAFTGGPKPEQSFLESLDMFSGSYLPQHDAAMWAKADAKSPPMLGGKPLDYSTFSNGHLRLIPVKGNTYRMQVETGKGGITDVRDADGGLFLFDAAKLAGALK
mgnify:FL=1